jgi:hypothetical protein
MPDSVAAADTQVLKPPQVLRTPNYGRDSFLRPPDWRYIEAQDYLREEKAGRVSPPPTDPTVQYLIRLLRGLSNPDSRLAVLLKWRDAADVIHIGTAARESAFSQELEDHIIDGTDIEDIKQMVGGTWFTAVHYHMFRSFFFDLSDVCAVTAWINYHLLDNARNSKQGALLRNRLTAYCEGGKAAIESNIPGNDDNGGLLKRYAQNVRQQKIFDYLTQKTNLPKELYASLMETAVKDMTTREFQEHLKDKEAAGDSSLQELAGDLSEGVRRFTLDEQQTYDAFGLSYSNQYTSIILNKDPENGAENNS